MDLFGIDLGTTYCAIARVSTNHPEPRPIRFAAGCAFPSLVLLAPGANGPRVVVGDRARAAYAALVGRRADPPAGVHLIRGAKNHIGRVPEGAAQGPPWVVNGEEFTATDVSALLLLALQKYLQRQNVWMTRVVVTHPQKFRNLQRLATQQAAELAGLDVVGLLTEPDAAAWAYESKDPSTRPLRTVVFDFGGGTLDVVLMETTREGARLATQVVASEGRTCGGLEIDECIAAKLMDAYGRATSVDPDDLRAQARDEFMAHAERVKLALNSPEAASDPDWRDLSYNLQLDNLTSHPPAALYVELGHLSDWVSHVLDRAIDTLRGALRKAGWTAASVDAVRMTGQSSLLVAMRERVAREFGREKVSLVHDPGSYLHPATIVAAGAALSGAGGTRLVSGALPEGFEFTSRLSRDQKGAPVFEGIPANTATPATKVQQLALALRGQTLPDGGRTLPIEVFEGLSRTSVGTYLLTFDRPLRDCDEVDVALTFAANGRFSMRVRVGDQFREARLTDAECILNPQELERRRAFLRQLELEV
jgi:molecular chaperone DnaK (HSP70)